MHTISKNAAISPLTILIILCFIALLSYAANQSAFECVPATTLNTFAIPITLRFPTALNYNTAIADYLVIKNNFLLIRNEFQTQYSLDVQFIYGTPLGKDCDYKYKQGALTQKAENGNTQYTYNDVSATARNDQSVGLELRFCDYKSTESPPPSTIIDLEDRGRYLTYKYTQYWLLSQLEYQVDHPFCDKLSAMRGIYTEANIQSWLAKDLTSAEVSAFASQLKNFVSNYYRGYAKVGVGISNYETACVKTITDYANCPFLPRSSANYCGDGFLNTESEQCDVALYHDKYNTIPNKNGRFAACNQTTCKIKSKYTAGYKATPVPDTTPIYVADLSPQTQNVVATTCAGCGTYSFSYATSCQKDGETDTPSNCWENISRTPDPAVYTLNTICSSKSTCSTPPVWLCAKYDPSTPSKITDYVPCTTGSGRDFADNLSTYSTIAYNLNSDGSPGAVSPTHCSTGYFFRTMICASQAQLTPFTQNPEAFCGSKPPSYFIDTRVSCQFMAYRNGLPPPTTNDSPSAYIKARGDQDTGFPPAFELPPYDSMSFPTDCTATYTRTFKCIDITAGLPGIFVDESVCTGPRPLPNPMTPYTILQESRCSYSYRCRGSDSSSKLYTDCDVNRFSCNTASCQEKVPISRDCVAVRYDQNNVAQSSPIADSSATCQLAQPASFEKSCAEENRIVGCYAQYCTLKSADGSSILLSERLCPEMTSEMSISQDSAITSACLLSDSSFSCGSGVLDSTRVHAVCRNVKTLVATPTDTGYCSQSAVDIASGRCDVHCQTQFECTQNAIIPADPNDPLKPSTSYNFRNLSEYGYIPQTIRSRQACNTADPPSISNINLCGDVYFVTQAVCIRDGEPVPDSNCTAEGFTKPTEVIKVQYKRCKYHCFDGTKSQLNNNDYTGSYLSECDSNSSTLTMKLASSDNMMICGNDTTLNDCTESVLNITRICGFYGSAYVGSPLQFKQLDPSYCPSNSNKIAPSEFKSVVGSTTTIVPLWSPKCFKVQNDLILHEFNMPSFQGKLPELTATSTTCKIAPLCKYQYRDVSVGQPNFMELSQASHGEWNTGNCANTYPNCGDACGIIDRHSKCAIFSSSSTTVDLTSKITFMTNNDIINQLCLPMVVYEGSCVNIISKNCYEPHCALPVTFSYDDNSNIVIDSSTSFTASNCASSAQTEHCSTHLQTKFCGVTPLTFGQKCWNRQLLKYQESTDECVKMGLAPTTTNLMCANYQRCGLLSQQCSFQVELTGVSLSQYKSETLCDDFVNNTVNCDDYEFCGSTVSTSSCMVVNIDEYDPTNVDRNSFYVDPVTCHSLFDPMNPISNVATALKQYRPVTTLTKRCTNYRQCSNFACSTTSSTFKHTQAQLAALPASAFHPSTGTINEHTCEMALSSSTCDKQCGFGSINRVVGCLRRFTPTWHPNKSIEFVTDYNDGECGKFGQEPPMASLPCSGYDLCSYDYRCAAFNAPFNSGQCNNLFLRCPDSPYNAENIPQNAQTNYTFTFNNRCVAANNGTVVSIHNCDLYASYGQSSLYSQTLCNFTPLSDYCQSNIRVPIDFTPNSYLLTESGQVPVVYQKLTTSSSTKWLTPQLTESESAALTGDDSLPSGLQLYRGRYQACNTTVSLTSQTLYKQFNMQVYAINDVDFLSYIDNLRISFAYNGPDTTFSLLLFPIDGYTTHNTNTFNAATYPTSHYHVITHNTTTFTIPMVTALDGSGKVISSPSLQFSEVVQTYHAMPLYLATYTTAAVPINFNIPQNITSGKYALAVYVDKYNMYLYPQKMNLLSRRDYEIKNGINTTTRDCLNGGRWDNTNKKCLCTLHFTGETCNVSKCSTIKCYNGVCMVDALTGAPTCQCMPGYQHTDDETCAKHTQCEAIRQSGDIAQNNNIPIPQCDLQRGVLLPSVSDTAFTVGTARPLECRTCQCLGPFNPSTGCSTCQELFCGLYGNPDNTTCTTCQCASGYSGPNCECYTQQFTINYQYPPPIIQMLYSTPHASLTQFYSQEFLDNEVEKWKKLMLSDLSRDLAVSIDQLSVVSYGSLGVNFVVIFGLKHCEPSPLTLFTDNDLGLLPIVENLTPDEKKRYVASITPSSLSSDDSTTPTTSTTFVSTTHVVYDSTSNSTNKVINVTPSLALQHDIKLQMKFLQFTMKFDMLKRTISSTSGSARIPQPTFNYTTLYYRNVLLNRYGVSFSMQEFDIYDPDYLDNFQKTEQPFSFSSFSLSEYIKHQYNTLTTWNTTSLGAYPNDTVVTLHDDESLMIVSSASTATPPISTIKITPSSLTPTTYASYSSPLNNGVQQYVYRQTSTASGVSADLNGGFGSFGDVYDDGLCSRTYNSKKCLTAPTLTATFPSKPPKQRVSISNQLLGIIIFLIVFVIIFVVAVVLCCTWKYQICVFKDFKKKRLERRKALRAQREQQMSELTNSTVGGANDASTLKSTNGSLQQQNGQSQIGNNTPQFGGVNSTTKQPNLTSKSIATPNTGAMSPNGPMSSLNLDGNNPNILVIDANEDDDSDDYFDDMEIEIDEFDENDPAPELSAKPSVSSMHIKRRSIHIGGLRKISEAGLPPGWTMLMLEGTMIYINEKTMQSSKVRPNPDGTLPLSGTKGGSGGGAGDDDYSSGWN